MINKPFLFVGLLLMASAPLFAVTPTPEQIERFSSIIKEVLEAQNPTAVRALYSTDGVPEEFVDEALSNWEEQAKDVATGRVSYDSMEFVSLDEHAARWGPKTTHRVVDPLTMNGHVYIRNPPVIGFMHIKCTSEGSTTKGNFSGFEPVGFDGKELKMTLLKRQDGSNPPVRTPLPLPPRFGKPPSAAAVEAFTAIFSKSCQSGSIDDYKACVSPEGISEAGMDQIVFRWGSFSVAQVKEGKATFEGAKFIPLEELRARRGELPAFLGIEPVVRNGNVYASNLPLVGVMEARFKSNVKEEDGSTTATTHSIPVGTDSHGNLKIASQVRVVK